jgi:hypothetical protein
MSRSVKKQTTPQHTTHNRSKAMKHVRRKLKPNRLWTVKEVMSRKHPKQEVKRLVQLLKLGGAVC